MAEAIGSLTKARRLAEQAERIEADDHEMVIEEIVRSTAPSADGAPEPPGDHPRADNEEPPT